MNGVAIPSMPGALGDTLRVCICSNEHAAGAVGVAGDPLSTAMRELCHEEHPASNAPPTKLKSLERGPFRVIRWYANRPTSCNSFRATALTGVNQTGVPTTNQGGISRKNGYQNRLCTSKKTLRPVSTPVAPSCSGAAVVPNSRWCG
jgi:hypothetical protein